MAFTIKQEKGSTVVVITDPRLAAAVKAIGYMWDDVKDQPIAESVLIEMIDVLEQFSERFPSVQPHPAEHKAAPGAKDAWFAKN